MRTSPNNRLMLICIVLFCTVASFQASGKPLYTFTVSSIGKINIDVYAPWSSGSWSGTGIDGGFQLDPSFKCPEGECLTSFRWIQMIVTNEDSNIWSGEPPKIKDSGIDLNSQLWGEDLDDYMKEKFYIYLDPWNGDPRHDSEPFYNNNESELSNKDGYTYALEDSPKRLGDGVWYNNVKHPLEWSAEMALVCAYDNTISYLGSVLWGWERLKSDPPVAKVPTFSATSGTLKKMVQLGHPNYQVVSNACCKVPEPSTLMLMSIGLVMLAYRRRGSL